MKTALITGGAGFIAHHLIARILIQTDWNIVTLDRLDYSGISIVSMIYYNMNVRLTREKELR